MIDSEQLGAHVVHARDRRRTRQIEFAAPNKLKVYLESQRILSAIIRPSLPTRCQPGF